MAFGLAINVIGHGGKIVQHVAGRNPQGAYALLEQEGVAARVLRRTAVVTVAVDLDRQSNAGAVEVST